MTKQMFIYEDVKPLSKSSHGDWSVKSGDDYGFAAKINSVPLLISEFAQASRHFPIVFTGSEERVMPIAILGIRNEQNVFVAEDGTWTAPYVPAFLRQYPFVFANMKEEGQLMLCLDEAFSGLNKDGKGERLFDSDGEQTKYLSSMLEFTKSYHSQFRIAENFGKRLMDLKLLEPMRAQFTMQGLPDETLTGFLSVTRQGLKDLPDEEVVKLHRNGMLEAIYVQLMSAGNFDDIVRMIQQREVAR